MSDDGTVGANKINFIRPMNEKWHAVIGIREINYYSVHIIGVSVD